jgi:hypothetical protein
MKTSNAQRLQSSAATKSKVVTRQSNSTPSNATTTIISPLIAPATPQREQGSQAGHTSQTLPQPPTLPQPRIASTTGLQAQSSSSTTVPVQLQPRPQTQSCPPNRAPAQRNLVQRVFDKFVAWMTIAMGLAAIVVAVYYGAVMLNYARWTKHNDFREGCINDRDHNLPLSSDCVSELMLPRVSAVKRQIEAVQEAYVENALQWTVAICIPVLTYIFYSVWMRVFVRDEPKPVVSLVRIDLSNCIQGYRGNESAVIPENDNDLSGPSHVQDDKVYEHLQQAQMDSTPSDSESEEDYFQAWKDKMKSPHATLEAGDFHNHIRSTPYSPGPIGHLRRAAQLRDDRGDIVSLDWRRGSDLSISEDHENGAASDLRLTKTNPQTSGAQDSEPPAIEPTRPRLFEVEFQPSGNRVECEHIELDGALSAFQPTDGLRLDVVLIDEFDGSLVLKCPLERGATHVELLNEYNRFPPSCKKALLKRDIWARRLGLPSHRFLYIIATGYSSSRS